MSLLATAANSTLPLDAESQTPRDAGRSEENPSDRDTIALVADSVCDVTQANDRDTGVVVDVGPLVTRSSESRLDSASIVESHSFCGGDAAMPLVFTIMLAAVSTLACVAAAAKPAEVPNLNRFMRTMPGLRTELAVVVQWKWWCAAVAYSCRSTTSPRKAAPPPPVGISSGIRWFPPTRPPSFRAAGTSTSETSNTGLNAAFFAVTVSSEMMRAMGGDNRRSATSRESSTGSVEPMWLVPPSRQPVRGFFFSIALVAVLAAGEGEVRQGLGECRAASSGSSECSTPFVSGVETLAVGRAVTAVRCGITTWHSRAPKALFAAGSPLPACRSGVTTVVDVIVAGVAAPPASWSADRRA